MTHKVYEMAFLHDKNRLVESDNAILEYSLLFYNRMLYFIQSAPLIFKHFNQINYFLNVSRNFHTIQHDHKMVRRDVEARRK